MSQTFNPLLNRPVVPCTICRINMVPLGPMGDNGKKKCPECKNRLCYQNRAKCGKKYYMLRTAVCVRCGKEYQGNRKQVCQICEMLIKDLYTEKQNKECLYCSKPTGAKDYCSRTCISNVLTIVRSRRKKIDDVLRD